MQHLKPVITLTCILTIWAFATAALAVLFGHTATPLGPATQFGFGLVWLTYSAATIALIWVLANDELR